MCISYVQLCRVIKEVINEHDEQYDNGVSSYYVDAEKTAEEIYELSFTELGSAWSAARDLYEEDEAAAAYELFEKIVAAYDDEYEITDEVGDFLLQMCDDGLG